MSAEHLETLFGLRGKVALVTGASSGLGVEFAQGLAMAGADVAVVARRHERLQAVVTQLEAFGVRALAVPTDLREEVQIDAALQQVQEDRKSTRLNSSHSQISYAVFCLKKKKQHLYVLSHTLPSSRPD